MTTKDFPTLTLADLATRDAAGLALREVAKDNPDIWALTADVMHSTGIEAFVRAFPERYVNVGIAEQTLMAAAAGLATSGKIPFAATFAFLASMRACEQIRTDIAYPSLNVKIYATHGGLALAKGGTTHHATEDVAIMRAMANMTVVVPADAREAQKVIAAAAAKQGPVYIRLGRGRAPIVYSDDFDYQIGRANLLRSGNDVTLIGCGATVAETLIAAELLAERGVNARVIDMHTIKPIDAEIILDAVAHTGGIFTVEDHNILAGLGGAVAEVMAETGASTPLRRLGLRDVYAGIGPEDLLFEKHGLSGSQIAKRVLDFLH